MEDFSQIERIDSSVIYRCCYCYHACIWQSKFKFDKIFLFNSQYCGNLCVTAIGDFFKNTVLHKMCSSK
jgi:hypothetical protein